MSGAFLFAALVGAVEIVASGSCPTDGDVAERLRALLPEAGGPREIARITSEGGGARVELYDGNGTRLAERRLQAAPCGDLAQAAAVVIAAWESELRSSTAEQVKLPAPRPRRYVGVEVSGSFLASLSPEFAPGGALAIAVGEKRGHFLGRLELAGFGTRDLGLDAGHVSWTRAWAALGPLLRFRPSRFVLDVHLEGLIALLYFRGVNFTTTDSGFDVDVGLGGGVRGAVRAGPMRFFLGVGVAGWLRRESVQVMNGGVATLPRVEALLSAGLSYGND